MDSDAIYCNHIFPFDTNSLSIQPECSVVDDNPEIHYILAFFYVPLMEMIRDETNRNHTYKMRDVQLGRCDGNERYNS